MYVPPDWGTSPPASTLAPRPQTVPARTVPRQAPPAATWAQGPAPRVPVVRGQNADQPETAPPQSAVTAAAAYTPPPVPVSIPSPRAFGVADVPEQQAGGNATGTDWTTVRQRMKEVGIVAFKVLELPQGGWRFVCDVRTTQPGRLRRIETGPAATEAEAITLALAEAGRPDANDR
ncbi:MAG: hypothetical protein HYS12_06100 [Planctomycetes bacterium]|nr:hypothetical protein [Planctomycetota bacterium]